LDRRALWTALHRGWIDTIGSDHAPHTRAEKAVPYWEAPSGIPGVETSLPLLLSGVHFGKLNLERMVELMSETPARIFGLKKKGAIAEGMDADLVLFREGHVAPFHKSSLLTRVGWSPFEGRELGLKPDLVVVNGRIVARGGEIVDDESRGREVRHKNGK
jgi:dihydroorotase